MKFPKKPLLPGFATGAYESRPAYNRAEFDQYPERRSSHVNIRLSASDLESLQRIALRDGVPLSSFIAGIVRRYLEVTAEAAEAAQAATPAEAAPPPDIGMADAPAIDRRARQESDR